MRTLAILFFAAALQQTPVVIDRIEAVVSGQPIMLSDVAAATEFQLVTPPAGSADRVGYVVDRLIRRQLMLAEVERFQPPEPDPVEITIRIDAMRQRAGSAAAFDKELAVTGLTGEQLRRWVRDDLRITTYLNQRFGDAPGRDAAIDAWVVELRKRTEITTLSTPR
jgi:hypothetical protein